MNAPANQPLLEVALRTSFLRLAEDPGREIVIGTLVAAPRRERTRTSEEFASLDGPGYRQRDFELPGGGDPPRRVVTR